MRIEAYPQSWEFKQAFRIAYRMRTQMDTVVVEIERDGLVGRGEAAGVSYHGETPTQLLEHIEAIRPALELGISRSDLATLMAAGGARNAIDCALWDLEAKTAGVAAWQLAVLPPLRPLRTAYTLGLADPESLATMAAAAAQYPLLKIKLDGIADVERVAAVRYARPDARIIVDANQAWSERLLLAIVPALAALGVELIEQPLPVGEDAALAGFDSPIPLCADESCQTTSSLPALVGKYEFINIKLDKTEGLTEALRLARAAQEAGLRLMVGCMGGSSLAVAPAFLVGQLCEIVDLEAPLLAKADMPSPIIYQGDVMAAPSSVLWG